MNSMDWMERVAYAYGKALQAEDSVVWVNRRVPTEAKEKWDRSQENGHTPVLFGVKDTNQIPMDLAKKLAQDSRFVWMSVDRMAPFGRALDPDLVNPITGRRMTGSTSGGAVNILRGIHDVAIGTDGGGSVLGPALAASLFGINAKGLGLVGKHPSASTEGYPLQVGIGAISHTLSIARAAVEVLLGEQLPYDGPVRIALDDAVPEPMKSFIQENWTVIVQFSKDKSFERSAGMKQLECLFASCDVVISYEGPVDVEAYADSIASGEHVDSRGGKYLLRSANLVNATAVTVPSGVLASGYVITAPEGRLQGAKTLAVAEALVSRIPRSRLFEDYFMNRMRSLPASFFNLEV